MAKIYGKMRMTNIEYRIKNDDRKKIFSIRQAIFPVRHSIFSFEIMKPAPNAFLVPAPPG